MSKHKIEKELTKLCDQACNHLDHAVSMTLNKHGQANLKRLVRALVLPLGNLIPHMNAAVGKADTSEWVALLIKGAHIHSYQRLIGNTNQISTQFKKEVLDNWILQIEKEIGMTTLINDTEAYADYLKLSQIPKFMQDYLEQNFESVFLPSMTLHYIGDESEVWLGQTMGAIHMYAVQKALEEMMITH